MLVLHSLKLVHIFSRSENWLVRLLFLMSAVLFNCKAFFECWKPVICSWNVLWHEKGCLCLLKTKSLWSVEKLFVNNEMTQKGNISTAHLAQTL